MKSSFRLIPMASALMVSACASAPVHYHTMLPPITQEATARPQASFLIDVLPVDVPAQLDQSSLVVRQGQSGVVVLDGERWTSSFGDEVHDALSSELIRLLSTQDIAESSIRPDQSVVRVKVHIRRFDAWLGQHVQLVADWELTLANDPQNAHVVRNGQFDEAAVGGYPEMTDAYQRAITDLARRVASDALALEH